MATTQVLVNSGERLQMTFAVDGVATNADAEVTVTVTGDDGTALATDALTDAADTGVYAYPLDPLSRLDRLTFVWTGTFSGIPQSITSYVDIVGGVYLSLAEIRAMKNLTDPVKFPTAALIEARQWFETTFEKHTGRAFVPRYRRLEVWGSGTDTLVAPDWDIRSPLRGIRYGTVTLSDLSLSNIKVGATGVLKHAWPFGTNGTDESYGMYGSVFPVNSRITLVYDYGADEPPEDIREAARIAIRSRLLDDNTGNREYAVQNELGIVRLSQPGPDRPFGIPTVDAVANAYQRRDRKRGAMTVGTVGIG